MPEAAAQVRPPTSINTEPALAAVNNPRLSLDTMSEIVTAAAPIGAHPITDAVRAAMATSLRG